jgi:hypothetical protein
LEILTLTSFIVAQPVLEVFGESPETFIFRGASRLDMGLFALFVTLEPTVILWALGGTLGAISARTRQGFQAAVIWILLGLLCVQVIKRLTPLTGVTLALTGVLIGTVFAWGILGLASARRWLRLAWPVSVVFVLMFLLLSSVSKLFLPQQMGRAAAAGAAHAPVVFVLFDQLPLASLLNPAGEIDRERFPNFARLAQGSTWYRNYTVSEPYTVYSVPTIVTGQLVRDRSKKPVAGDYPDNLFTLLRETHDLNVETVTDALCPQELCAKTVDEADADREGLAMLLKDAAGIWADISLPGAITRDITAQFEEAPVEVEESTPEERRAHVRRHRVPLGYKEFVESLNRGRRPGLHYLHLSLPHWPWRFFPSGLEYQRLKVVHTPPVDRDSIPNRWLNAPWPMELIRQRHILQVQFADRLLGDLIDRLQKQGMYDEALVIVTSDHGHSFGPGRPRQSPNEENLHEVMWVPLIVKEPGQKRGRVDDANIMATDLLPTIADVLRVQIPWRTDGTSALRREADRGPLKTFIRHRDGKRVPWPTGPVTIPSEEAWARLTREAVDSLPSSDPTLLPYLVGPHPELIGKRVGELTIGGAAPISVKLDAPGALDAVDPASGVIPAIISGTASAPNGTSIAVALNGRIAGVWPTFSQNGIDGRFQVLAPESFIKAGRNSLRVFVVDGGSLRPVRSL